MGSSASILNDKLVYQSEKLFYNTFSKNSNGRIIINPDYKTHNDDNVMKDYYNKMMNINVLNKLALVLYDYNTSYPEFNIMDELKITKDQIIIITGKSTIEGWYNGKYIDNSKSGLVPKNFVETESSLFIKHFCYGYNFGSEYLRITKIYNYVERLEKMYGKKLDGSIVNDSSKDLFWKTFALNPFNQIVSNPETKGYSVNNYYDKLRYIILSKSEKGNDSKIDLVISLFNDYFKVSTNENSWIIGTQRREVLQTKSLYGYLKSLEKIYEITISLPLVVSPYYLNDYNNSPYSKQKDRKINKFEDECKTFDEVYLK
jgi:hypothetical protein